MAKRKTKCGICEQSFDDNSHMTKVGTKYYCNDGCLLEKEKKDQDEQYRRTVIQILLEVNDTTYVNPVWLRLIKTYHEESGYSYRGMVTVLNYMRHNLQLENKSEMHYINSIPYHYLTCKTYYQDVLDRKKKVEEFVSSGKEFFSKTTMKVKTTDGATFVDSLHREKIDMESLLEGYNE